MIFYKSDRQILISKDENAAKTRTVTFLEVKFGSVINGMWMPPLVMGVLITAAVLETCASEEPGEELTHIAERSSWDEQEDCPRQSYGKNLT